MSFQAQLQTTTAAWLPPIVTTIVTSTTGGVLTNVLLNDQHVIWTIVLSYIF
jgi:tellurite resistance protein TehA-like permease